MENNFDEIAAFLDGIGQEIEQVTTSTLQDLANTIPQELRREIFREKTNRTGGLYNSISAQVRGDSLVFGMRAYGYFNVFGVSGNPGLRSLGIPQPYAGATDKQAGDRYKFTKINNRGIRPVQSAAETLESIADLIVEALTE